MQNNTATPAAMMDELAAEVARLRAQLAAHEEAQRLVMYGLAALDAEHRPTKPRLRVITCSGRRRTARRGKLTLVGGAA